MRRIRIQIVLQPYHTHSKANNTFMHNIQPLSLRGRSAPYGIQTTSVVFFFHLGILVQDLHHRSLLLFVFYQHAASSADIFDNIDHFAEAGGRATSLGESCEAEVGAAPVFKYNEKFDDEGDGFDL